MEELRDFVRWRAHWMTEKPPKPLNYYIYMVFDYALSGVGLLLWGAALLGWIEFPVNPVWMLGWVLVIGAAWKFFGASLCLLCIPIKILDERTALEQAAEGHKRRVG